jgi:hypothetical protein
LLNNEAPYFAMIENVKPPVYRTLKDISGAREKK